MSLQTRFKRNSAVRWAILAVLVIAIINCQAARAQTSLRWSTDYTAVLETKRLSMPAQRLAAIDALRRLHIDKVYLEVTLGLRGADPAELRTIRDAFRAAGIQASALVATVGLPKPSTALSGAACYTNRANREYVARLFQRAASFNEIIIDDWLFTDCQCSQCAAAKGSMSWQQYRKQLMLQVSRDNILSPARRINPRVHVILKFPNWYDNYQKWGYEVPEETALYDRIWVGTEMRDPSSSEHKQQYGGFFLYRWLNGIGGKKIGGAWFDLYATNPAFYLDQAYVSVLAGAPEIMLYSDASHEVSSSKYQAQTQALIDRQPNLDALAKLVGNWQGIPAYKPPSSSPGNEPYIFDQVGMLGIPLLPTSKFPKNAKAAFFADYAMSDPEFIPELIQFFNQGGTAFVSQDLAHRLNQDPRLPIPQGFNLVHSPHLDIRTSLHYSGVHDDDLSFEWSSPLAARSEAHHATPPVEYLKTIQEGQGKMIVFSDDLLALTAVDSSNRVEQQTPELQAALLELRQSVRIYSPLSLDAPPRVGVFPMGKRIAVMNFTELPVECHVTGTSGITLQLRQLLTTPAATLNHDQSTLHLPPHGLLMMEIDPTRLEGSLTK